MTNKLTAARLACWLIVAVSLTLAGNLKGSGQLLTGAALHPVAASPAETTPPALDPEIYHHVSQVTWVVSDIDRIVAYWHQLGIKDIRRNGVVQFPLLTYRGTPDPASAKQATANIGQMQINWVQPLRGGKFWHDQLREHGDGIRVLSYVVRSSREFDDQITYFASRGVGVVVQDSWRGPTGRGRMAYLDTAARGGGTMLGLIDDPETRSRKGAGTGTAKANANEYPLVEIKHFAWVVNDVRKVDAYYTSLGFKPLSSIDHNVSLDRIYRGQPGNYEMWLGWNRTGDAPFEWVQQITGADVYVEFGKKHGGGFHHLGVLVADMDEAIKLLTKRGAVPSQAASWNTKNGKGRAVYMDTEPHGGVTLELIYDPQ